MASITDPLGNEIRMERNGIGIGILEIGEVHDFLVGDIIKTLRGPACILESTTQENTRYYFQHLRKTTFQCIVKKNPEGWYLEDTIYNPGKERFDDTFLNSNLLFSK